MARQSLWQEGLRWTVRPIWYLGSNVTSRIGIMLTTASAITIISLYTSDAFGVRLGPYVGIIAYVLLPALFVFGLLLIPAGMWFKRRREKLAGLLPDEYPQVDLRDRRVRETAWFVLAMTAVNLALLLTATYRGVHYMDSVQFCGLTCHSVMHPEFIGYQNSPHARVPCVECHIGPGAPWFVRSKLSGVYQVASVSLDLYSRPIPTPIENLRPSRETCEHCHWPLKFVGEKLIIRSHFADDEINTETKTALLMRTGGLDPLTREPRGNHGVHLQPGAAIYYVPGDARRQEIPYVRYERPDGEIVEYVADGAEGSLERWREAEDLRLMDCMDCHNRPTHSFKMPDVAVDEALAAGVLDRSLPYLKQQALEALQAEYASQAEAADGIRARLGAFYQTHHQHLYESRRTSIEAAADALVEIYGKNVFPEMKLLWGTYPNNIGHQDFPGCFRCHDGSHTSADGATIAMDCGTCHELLAMDESEPEILKHLGIE